jgi:hypothetical protein
MSSRKQNPKAPSAGARSSTPHRRPSSVVLVEENRLNRVSSWLDQVAVSQTAQGLFSVTARKFVERDDKPKKHWITLEDISSIKSPSSLIKALNECAELLSVDLSWDDVLSKLAEIDWPTAAAIAAKEDLDSPALPSLGLLTRQLRRRRLGKVNIYVSWGYERHDLTLPFQRWLEILKGQKHTPRTRYTAENGTFTAHWRFDVNDKDQLDVEYVSDEDGGVGWTGSLQDIDGIEGPKLEDVDLAKAALSSANLSAKNL